MIVPYIPFDQRNQIDRHMNDLKITSEGQFAYALTRLINAYASNEFAIGYAKMASVIGILDSTKSEFYRQVMAVYEDDKKAENGGVRWVG